MIASDSESADSNIQTASRQSTRKRKLVNYKEPSTVEDDDDADSDDVYEVCLVYPVCLFHFD